MGITLRQTIDSVGDLRKALLSRNIWKVYVYTSVTDPAFYGGESNVIPIEVSKQAMKRAVQDLPFYAVLKNVYVSEKNIYVFGGITMKE